MKLLAILLALGAGAGTAEAATVICSGSQFGYNVHMTAKMSGARFTSKATVTVSRNRMVIKRMSVRITSSTFVPQQRLAFTGVNPEGNVSFDSAWDGQSYAGTVTASSPRHGTMSAPGACVIR